MKAKLVIYLAFLLLDAVDYVESGILVTSPRIFRTGSTQELAVSLFSVPVPWVVNATLHHEVGARRIIASDEAQFTSLSDGTLKLEIPRHLIAGSKTSINGKLTVHGGPVGGKHDFLASEVIEIEIPKISIFIQTDKPIYKPGQTVNMRIVGTDENLKPLKGKISRVTVTNPNKVKTMQWNNLEFLVGIASLKFPLSSQPDLGDWNIEAQYEGEKKALVFKVDKYVLPKFEVTITPPPFVALKGNKDITATICAWYTYGQPVKGKVSVTFSLHNSQSAKQTKVEHKISGCRDISISPRLLGLSAGGQRHNADDAKIVIKATVTEAATNVTQNATEAETEVVSETAILEFLSTTPTNFKQGMPFTGQVQATWIDGTPLKGESLVIVAQANNHHARTIMVFRKSFTIPADGIVNFVVPGSKISQGTKSLKLKALYKGTSIATKDVNNPWFSPSNSYIEMKKFTSPRSVGSIAKVMFYFTTSTKTKNITFHYQVFSRGKLVAQGRKLHSVDYKQGMNKFRNSKNEEMFSSQGFIEFVVTLKMVPSCRILLFYVRDDKETVAANMVIDTEDTLENEVNIHFADSVRQPGEQTRLIITAAQGSQVALTAVDKSVHLLKGGYGLNEADAIGALMSQDIGSSGRDSCYVEFHSAWRGRYRKKGQKDLDASKAFKDSGVIHFSDLKIKTAKCNGERDYHVAAVPIIKPYCGRFGFMGCFGFFGRHYCRTRRRVTRESRDEKEEKPETKKRNVKQKPLNVRKEFLKTWLWTEGIISEQTGKTVLSVKVPDTITSWVASAFAMSDSAGLGISKPTSLKVFQPFFVSLTLPYSVIRGEEVSLIATVFNYESKCLTIRLGLEDSLDYRITSTALYDICVCSNETKSVHFDIVPKKLGQMPLAVVAKDVNASVCAKDVEQIRLGVNAVVIRKLLVEPEGVHQEYTYNSFVCLKDESYFKDTIEISLPQNVVPGSAYAMVSTSGDLMGPALNVETLLRLPRGCGEQNMVNFAPTIYIMKYLSSVGRLSESVEEKAKNIMTIGYQRELTYKRTDGSYSAFGNGDSEGNMWLTAFVLRSFAQARPFIFVDPAELRQTQAWITGKQKPDGCFPKYGRIIDKKMKGGLTTEATLTAFVTLSLLESGMSPANNVIQSALNCLRSSSSNLTDSYSLALFAYTFTLAKDRGHMELFYSLQDKAILEDGLMHWGRVKEARTTPPRQLWWNPYHRAPAAEIEMTAYALMTYVLLAKDDPSLIAQTMSIVRWLTKQRNALGGFASTQDTCVGLQALSKYASHVYSPTSSLTVQFGKKDDQQFSQTFNITDDNRLVSQRAEVPSSFLPIKKLPVEVTGQGCALMQADVSYNIPDVTGEPAFDLNVTLQQTDDVFAPLATQTGELLCLPLKMLIFAKWLKEDTSNMAVIDVKLVSGYEANEESLQELLSVPSLGIKRYEIEGQHVILYFDEIDKVAFSFKIYQSTVVKKTKPAAVTVYDYYETHFSATVMYKITEDMCGPDQIP